MRTGIGLLVLPIVACTIGTPANEHMLIAAPRGIELTVTLIQPRTSYYGELVGVSDSAIVLLRGGAQVVELPYRNIRDARARIRTVRLGGGITPSADDRAAIAQLSRYPQGISPDLMRGLLSAYGQDSLIRPVPP